MGLVWCEQYLSSGLAALLIAVIPVFVALFEAFLPNGEGLRTRGWIGIAIGFGGLVILVSPGLRDGRARSRSARTSEPLSRGSAITWRAAGSSAR